MPRRQGAGGTLSGVLLIPESSPLATVGLLLPIWLSETDDETGRPLRIR